MVYPTTLTEDEALRKFIQEQLEKGVYFEIKVTICLTFLLYQKEGWKVMPSPRLSEAQ